MPSKPILLRILLSLLLCLNGSTALWASVEMALDPSHMTHAGHETDSHPGHADPAAACADATCTPEAAGHPTATDPSSDRHAHADDEDCRCGAGMIAGCGCNCGYPAGFIAVSVPFAAQHPLRSPAPAYARIHAPLQGSGTIFRPPIS